jgi:hypothetical protein
MSAPDLQMAGEAEEKLPKRDWILLPLLGFSTVIFLLGTLVLVSRCVFPQPAEWIGKCFFYDSHHSRRGIPNCVVTTKLTDTPILEYRLNGEGFRESTVYGRKSPGSYRIVMTGGSYTFGFGVPLRESLATLLPKELSQRTGRKIELYNESTIAGYNVAWSFEDIIAANPDLVLWAINPGDVENTVVNPGDLAGTVVQPPQRAERGFLGHTRFQIENALRNKPLRQAMPEIGSALNGLFISEKGLLIDSPATLIRDYIFQSQSEYLKIALNNSETNGFLRTQPDKYWQLRLTMFNQYEAAVEEHAHAAGVPLVITFVPNRAQAAMMSMGNWPPGYNPYKFGDDVRSMVQSHGGTYVDILSAFRDFPNAETWYYPVDGHPNAQGHTMIAKILTDELTSGAVPALDAADKQEATSKTRR